MEGGYRSWEGSESKREKQEAVCDSIVNECQSHHLETTY